jgi:hypothetical protein
MVVRTRDGLTTAQYSRGSDGDPEQQAEAIFTAVADQLATAVAG